MKHGMASVLIAALLVLAFLNGWMYLQQPAMVFFPYRALEATPGDWGLAYEEIWLSTPGGVRLHGWYIPHPGARRVLLLFHGNGGNISHRGDSVRIFNRLGLNVFIFDYRGYGRSGGKPSEEGLYEDGNAAWRYLADARGFRPHDIIVYGHSLGAAVAARVAAEHNPGRLILESSFSSVQDVAREVFPLLSRLVVLRYRFDTAAQLRRVTCPVLVLHSPQDGIIPYRLGVKVYQAANPPKTFVELRGGHNTGFLQSQPAYEHALAKFIG